jgi:hypothetical protein
MRLDVQRWYPMVRGERAVGLLTAHRLRLKPAQLAALERADHEVAREVAEAVRRRPAFMTAVEIRRLVAGLMRRSG